MTSERFDDELLSAILDGEADDTQVARVTADPEASVRLEQMRTVATIVGEEPPAASPERRRSSIAAAMAAAEPADPAVTSLTAARHERAEQVWTPDLSAEQRPRNTRWLAVAAAIALFVLAVPIIASLRPDPSDVATSADDAAEVTEAASDDADTSTADSAESDDAADAVDDAAMEDDAMEEEAAADFDAPEATSDAEDRPFTRFGEQVRRNQLQEVSSVAAIDELIASGVVTPVFSVEELLDAGVNPQCLEDDTGLFPAEFGAVNVGTGDGDLTNVVLIRFNDDGTTDRFAAQDCTPQ